MLTLLFTRRRKRCGDNAADYFNATEKVAGVKDMRFQALMPDVLHWLGVKKIDNVRPGPTLAVHENANLLHAYR